MDTSTIVILDFGSQYTQLIARRIREFNVFSVVLPCTAPLARIQALAPLGLILSGGPSSVYDAAAPAADPDLLTLGLPTLGICYGLQFITHHLGGKVESAASHEYGHAEVEIIRESLLFQGLPSNLNVWMSHGDHAAQLPPGFHITAQTSNATAAIADEARRIWAVQFHPEVAHTPQGTELLRNFVLNLCGAVPDWTPEHFIQSTIARVREQVGAGHAICGLSGGVDSSVAAVLVARAIGDRLTCIFVDTGLMRAGEADEVVSAVSAVTMRQQLWPQRWSHVERLRAIYFSANWRACPILKPSARSSAAAFIDPCSMPRPHEILKSERSAGEEVAWLVQGTLYP